MEETLYNPESLVAGGLHLLLSVSVIFLSSDTSERRWEGYQYCPFWQVQYPSPPLPEPRTMNRFFSSRQKHSSLPRGQGREITSHSVDASVIQLDFQAYRFLREFLQSAATFPARRPEQLVALEGIAVGETVAFKRLPLYIGHLYSNFVSGLHIETDLAAAPQKGGTVPSMPGPALDCR